MDTNDTTNPEAEAPEADAPEVDTEDTLAADADEAEGGEGEDEFEELDLDGDPLRVPKSAAEKLKARMMMQADYTQKTQSLAEQRREVEAQRQAVAWEREMESHLLEERAQLSAVRKRLDQFAQVNWQALAQEDSSQYAAAHAEYTQLKDFAEGLSGQIEGRRQHLEAAREQATAISVERAVTALNQPDPKAYWDGKFNGERSREMTEFLMEFGANPEVFKTILDPLTIKFINMAHQYHKLMQKQSAALKRPTPEAKPVPTVTSGKTRTGPSNPDKLSADEWLKWRESQLARKQQRSR